MMKKNRWRDIIVICIVSILVIFFMYKNEKEILIDGKNSETGETTHIDGKNEFSDRSINTWSVYWDNKDIVKEIAQMGSNVTSISYFAAYFDTNMNLFIPENIITARSSVDTLNSDTKYKSYLTFVNDVLIPSGGSSLKDTKLLYALLSTHKDRQKHINQIIEMTVNGEYDGLEIDYEAMKKDKSLWKYFVKFIDELYKAAIDKKLLVRVILEPNALVDEFDFPIGPEYVMMCYNLYGYGTEPGPKADKEFIMKLVEKMRTMPGKKGFAVANGGFDFDNSGKVKQISTKDAIKLQKINKKSSYRDKESGCMVFTYKDDLGISHEVWYADTITIDYLFDILEDLGEENLYLWRLGG